MRRFGVVSLALAAACGTGCGADPAPAHLPAFYDVATAPPPIQTAAAAVVRVHTAGSYGTGAFISPSGLLLTNNHILGDTVCPIEGCTIMLAFEHEKGKPPGSSMTVLAVPQAVDVGLDMAVVQIADPSGVPLSTPSFLTLKSLDAPSLLGTHVTVVGHPEGELKKWTSGLVTDAFGNWFATTAYTLPGDSGSPVLDDDGSLVGLIHRGATGEDLITSDGVNVSSIGTASAALAAAMAAPLPAVMVSMTAPTTAAAVVAHDLVYLNGRLLGGTLMMDGAPKTVLAALGEACDAALARTDFVSPDDLTSALAPCNDATRWIECRIDASPTAYGTVCPSAGEAAGWSSRYDAMNRLWVAMNGNTDLYPVSFGVAALAPSKASGLDAGGVALQQALAAAGQPLDFSVANYLAAFSVDNYGGTSSLAWLRSYSTVVEYELSANSIASAFLWWTDNGGVDESETLRVLDQLRANPYVSVGAKLYIEDAEYVRGH